jgi:hypothetical protein
MAEEAIKTKEDIIYETLKKGYNPPPRDALASKPDPTPPPLSPPLQKTSGTSPPFSSNDSG